MSKYIDAEVLKNNIHKCEWVHDIKSVEKFVDGLPAADVVLRVERGHRPSDDLVKVVRCKDCKHYQFADNRAFGMPVKMCEWFGFEDVDDNDFCSRAERKEE